MSNGDNRATWDLIFKISQIAVLPLLGAMFYMLMQMNALDRRLAIIEVTTARPQIDSGLIAEIAIIKERQNVNTMGVLENKQSLSRIESMIVTHDQRSRTTK